LILNAEPREASRNLDFLRNAFVDKDNRDVFLCSSSLYRYGVAPNQRPAETVQDRRYSAKLHVLFGTLTDVTPQAFLSTHPVARSIVYDIRRYTDGTLWGPFLDDGLQRIDGEKMEALMVDLGHNLRQFSERTKGLFQPPWDRPFTGVTPNSYTPSEPMIRCPHFEPQPSFVPLSSSKPKLSKQIDPALVAQDPYGITGTWRRVSVQLWRWTTTTD